MARIWRLVKNSIIDLIVILLSFRWEELVQKGMILNDQAVVERRIIRIAQLGVLLIVPALDHKG